MRDLALTTNGVLLAKHAPALRAAGLRRVTVSLDTLRPDRMERFARSARHADVLAGIGAAQAVGFERLKLNSVVLRGFNDDELADLIEFARAREAEVRFIEYMDVGGATHWSLDRVVSQREILDRLGHRYGAITPITGDDPARAGRAVRAARRHDVRHHRVHDRAVLPGLRSQPADRRRAVAPVPVRRAGVDLRGPLRDGASSDAELAALLRERGCAAPIAVPRSGSPLAERQPLYQVNGLRADPHREMHTRGG